MAREIVEGRARHDAAVRVATHAVLVISGAHVVIPALERLADTAIQVVFVGIAALVRIEAPLSNDISFKLLRASASRTHIDDATWRASAVECSRAAYYFDPFDRVRTESEKTSASGTAQVVVRRHAVDEELRCTTANVRPAAAAKLALAHGQARDENVQARKNVGVATQLLLQGIFRNHRDR